MLTAKVCAKVTRTSAVSAVALRVITASTSVFSFLAAAYTKCKDSVATQDRPDLAAVAPAKQNLLISLAVADRGFSSCASQHAAVR